MELNKPQTEAFMSSATETFMIGGVGMGKSLFLAVRLYQALGTKGVVCALFAPTVKTLKNATYPQVRAAWEMLGFLQNVHYVLNRRPPAHWRVPSYSDVSSNKILTTCWGSYCIVDGLENFDSQRGIEVDEIFVDEYRDVREEARVVLLGRLRGKAYRANGTPYRIWYATTPPDNPIYLQELIMNKLPDVKFVFGTTLENTANLSGSYLESLRNTLDEDTYNREVLGQLITIGGSRFAYSFDIDRHVLQSTPVPQYNAPACISFDFNVNPMTALLIQEQAGRIIVLKEFRKENTNLEWFLNSMREEVSKFQLIKVTGDPAGSARNIFQSENIGAYIYISKAFGIPPSKITVLNVAPPHQFSRIHCNNLFKKNLVYISPDCHYLRQDLANVLVDNDGHINKADASRTHLLDCLRYYLHTFHQRTDYADIRKTHIL